MAKYGMVLNETCNESAKKLSTWLKWQAWLLDTEIIDIEYDGASDSVQSPCTVNDFFECFESHVKGHKDDGDEDKHFWDDEFCPFCDGWLEDSDITAKQYEDRVKYWKHASLTGCVEPDCQEPHDD